MITVHPDILAEVEQFAATNPSRRVTLLTADGYICYRATSTAANSSIAAADVIGRHISEFIHPQYLDHVKLAFGDALLNDESIEIGAQLQLSDRSPAWARGKAYKLCDPETEELYVMTSTVPAESIDR
jgi:hypothetical protein